MLPHGPGPDRGFPESCRPRFRPLSVLGEGGFGRVFLALEEALGRQVAIKVLTAVDDAESLERFRAEARATAALSHPGIVQVIDHGDDGALPWIAYEYLPGESLRSVLARGAMPVQAALEAILQVADALQAAHEHGVVHRDVKPENVVALGGGAYKVIDFGIARWAGSSVRTRTGVIVGTPAYMAPEVIRGEKPGPSADVYALGVMAFELIAGRVPFDGARPLEVIESHLKREPPELAALRPDVPPSTAALVRRLLDKEPSARPRSMAAVRIALTRELGAAPRRRVPAVRRAGVYLAGTLIAAAAIGTALVATRSAPRPPVDRAASPPAPDVLDALRAFGARERLDALSAEWRQGHVARRPGAAALAPRDWSAWLSAEWQRTAAAFALAHADVAADGWRRAVEARRRPLGVEDMAAYAALHEVADLHAFFLDASGGDTARFGLLDCMPEPWRGGGAPEIPDATVFALVAATGGKSGRLPGSEGSVAALRLFPAWPGDDFQTPGYQVRRQASEGFAGTVLGAPRVSVSASYTYPDALPWREPRELELGACVRGWEVRDAIEARFEPRNGAAPVTLVLGRWNRGRPDGYLRVSPALIPRDARLTLRLRPQPWQPGAGLNLEWVAARFDAGAPPRRAPSPRNNLALGYDPVAGRVLLFGGSSRPRDRAVFTEQMEQDTWYWTGTSWLRVDTRPVPPAGSRHRLVTDAARRRLVLTGGKVDGGWPGSVDERREAWQWDGLRWAKLADEPALPDGAPPAGGPRLAWKAHVLDPDRGRTVLVGCGPDAMTRRDAGPLETWVTGPGGWRQLPTPVAPPGRIEFGLAYDATRRVIVLFGGQSFERVHDDTWELDGDAWLRKAGR